MNSVFINDAKYFIQDYLSVEHAVEKGELSVNLATAVGIKQVAVSHNIAPADLARTAISNLNFEGIPLQKTLFLHSTVQQQGLDFWPYWCYVALEIPSDNVNPIGISQMSSGAVTSIALASSQIRCGDSSAAVIATSDYFGKNKFDRWHSDHGTFFGDAGTSVILSHQPGPIEILSWSSCSDRSLEELYRGNFEPLQNPPETLPIELSSRVKSYLARTPYEQMKPKMDKVIQRAVGQCLLAAEFKFKDIDLFVVPHLGRNRIVQNICVPLEIDLSKTSWEMGRNVGHIGSGDQIWFIASIINSYKTLDFDNLLLIGYGASLTVTCILCRINRKLTI